jgi:hypothetical protein
MYIIEWSNALLHEQIDCHNLLSFSQQQLDLPHNRTRGFNTWSFAAKGLDMPCLLSGQ